MPVVGRNVSVLREQYTQRLEASLSSLGAPLVSIIQVEKALSHMGLVVSGERLVRCIYDVHDYCFGPLFKYVFELCTKGLPNQAEAQVAGLTALQQHMPIDLYPFLLVRDQPGKQSSTGSSSRRMVPNPSSVSSNLLSPALLDLFIQLTPTYAGSESVETSRFSRPLSMAEYTLVVRCVVDSLEEDANSYSAKEYMCVAPEGEYAMGNVIAGIHAALAGGLFAEEDDDATNQDEAVVDGPVSAFSGAELVRFLRKFSIDLNEQGMTRSSSSPPPPSSQAQGRALSRHFSKSSFGNAAALLSRRKSRASLIALKRQSGPSVPPTPNSGDTPVEYGVEDMSGSGWEDTSHPPTTSSPHGLSKMKGAELTHMLVSTVLGQETLHQEGVYKGGDRLRDVTAQRIDELCAQVGAQRHNHMLESLPLAPGDSQSKSVKRKPSASVMSRSQEADQKPSLSRFAVLSHLPSEIRPSDVSINVNNSPTANIPSASVRVTATTPTSAAGPRRLSNLRRQASMSRVTSPIVESGPPRVLTPRSVVDTLAVEDYMESCRDAVVDAKAARDDAFLCDNFLKLEAYHPYADRFVDPPPQEGEGFTSPASVPTHRRAEKEFESLGVNTKYPHMFDNTPVSDIGSCGLDELERRVEKVFELDSKAEAVARERDVQAMLVSSDRVRAALQSRETASLIARTERLQDAPGSRSGGVKGSVPSRLRFGVSNKETGDEYTTYPDIQGANSSPNKGPPTNESTMPRSLPMPHWMKQQVHRGRSFITPEVPVNAEEYRVRSRYLLNLKQHKAVEASAARARASGQNTSGSHSSVSRARYSAEVTPLRLSPATTPSRSNAGRPATSDNSMFGAAPPTPLPPLSREEQSAIDAEVISMMRSAPASRERPQTGPHTSVRPLVPDDVVHATHFKAKVLGLEAIPPEEKHDTTTNNSTTTKRSKSKASVAAKKLMKRRKLEKKRQEEELLVEWALRRRRDGFK